ncbi:MAG: class I SAM-dependent DNA methyltransferase [Rhodospirillaceae bacterium]
MTDVPAFATLQEAVAAARNAGNSAEAVAIFRSLPGLFPIKESIMCAAAGLRSCGEWSEAVALMEEALPRMPSHGLMHFLVDTYMEMNHFAQAASSLQKYLEAAPADGASWASLGRVHYAAENWAGAEQAFSHALSLKPLDVAAVLGLGDAFYRLGRPDEAIGAYRRAAALKPDDAGILFKLGSMLAVAQQAEEAESVLRRAIALEPGNAPAHVNLAGALHQSGRLSEAAEIARQAIALDAELVAAYSTLGTVLLEAGQFAAAAEVLRQGALLAPGLVAILIALATAENALGNVFAAEKVLQRILTVEPGNLEARHLLSAVHGEPVRSVPAGYSRQLFNWYAPKFDRMLSGSLKYRAPEDVVALLAEARPDPQAFSRLLDLGCGTGLVAQALAKHYTIAHKTGVDVAEKMIDISREKGLYDVLVHGDAAEALAGARDKFDLVTAIDMLIYVGDLAALMPLIAESLAAGGIFAYSIEVLGEGKYKLQRTGRFAHTVKYVEDLAAAAGLVPLASRPVTLRLENGADVTGRIGLLQRA